MIKDPLTRWDGVFPYDALAAVGITPLSSQAEVLDASFELMAEGLMTPEVRKAWDELRLLPRRLLVDLFLYPIDLEAEVRAALARLEAALRDPPQRLDVTELLAVDSALLDDMSDDCGAVTLDPIPIAYLPELDRPPAWLRQFDIEFDR